MEKKNNRNISKRLFFFLCERMRRRKKNFLRHGQYINKTVEHINFYMRRGPSQHNGGGQECGYERMVDDTSSIRKPILNESSWNF